MEVIWRKRSENTFEEARRNQPALILVDEFDNLFPQGQYHSKAHAEIFNQLQKIKNSKNTERIFVLGCVVNISIFESSDLIRFDNIFLLVYQMKTLGI
jgi:SpoVK/Ycf46/Vps4 family AAA+-type ATPase